MTFSPSGRLLWLVGILFLPACALPAFVPHGERYIAGSALFILLIAAFDLAFSRQRLAGVTALLPETIRATLHDEAKFYIQLRRSAQARHVPGQMRIAAALPAEIEPIRDDILLSTPQAGEVLKGEMVLIGRERGRFPIKQIFLGSGSWMGLWQLRRSVTANATVLVEPALSQIAKEAAKLLASHQHGGQRILARNGRGREFEQLREYVPSDDFGTIDWKATARRRIPIVRDYQIERTQDIYACVDFSRLSGRPVVTKDERRVTILDEYIRSTVMLQCAVRGTGDRFGLATFSNRVGHLMKATHAVSFDRVFRQALYPLSPQMVAPAFDEICTALRTRVKRRALIVFFTSLAEPQLADSFLEASRLLARRHLVIAACPMDAYAEPLFADDDVDRIEDIYGKVAGHLLWKKLTEVRLQLAKTGIRMRAVAPGRLGLMAATEYLEIKERQLL